MIDLLKDAWSVKGAEVEKGSSEKDNTFLMYNSSQGKFVLQEKITRDASDGDILYYDDESNQWKVVSYPSADRPRKMLRTGSGKPEWVNVDPLGDQEISYTQDEERRIFVDDFTSDTSGNYTISGSVTGWGTGALTLPTSSYVYVEDNQQIGKKEISVAFSDVSSERITAMSLSSNLLVLYNAYVTSGFFRIGLYNSNTSTFIKAYVTTSISLDTSDHVIGIDIVSATEAYLMIDGVRRGTSFSLSGYVLSRVGSVNISGLATQITCNWIQSIGTISDSDDFSADTTSRWALVAGTSATFDTDHVDLVTSSTEARWRRRHYKNQEGWQSLTVTLPTGADGDFVGLTQFSQSGALNDGLSVGLMSDGAGNWNLCTVDDTTATEGSDSGLDDADQVTIEVLSYQGGVHYWIYDATGTKPTDESGVVFTTKTEGYSGVYALGNAQTFQIDDYQARVNTLVGTTTGVSTKSIAWDYRVVGMQIDSTNSDPAVTIVDEDGNPMEWGTKQADQHAIWGRIRRCVIDPDNGNAITYGTNNRGDGLDLTGASGEVMVEIPIPYQKVVVDGTVTTVYFSPVAKTGYTKCGAANQRGQTDADYVYVGAFESSGALDS